MMQGWILRSLNFVWKLFAIHGKHIKAKYFIFFNKKNTYPKWNIVECKLIPKNPLNLSIKLILSSSFLDYYLVGDSYYLFIFICIYILIIYINKFSSISFFIIFYNIKNKDLHNCKIISNTCNN